MIRRLIGMLKIAKHTRSQCIPRSEPVINGSCSQIYQGLPFLKFSREGKRERGGEGDSRSL